MSRSGRRFKKSKHDTPLIIKFFIMIFVCMSLLYISFQLILLKKSNENTALREKNMYRSALQDGNMLVNEYFDGIGDMIFMLEKQIDLYGTGKLEGFLIKFKTQIPILSKSIYFIDLDERIYSTESGLYSTGVRERMLDFHRKANSSPSMGFSDPYVSSLSAETLAVYRSLSASDGNSIGTIAVEIDLEYFRSRLKATLTPDSPTLDLILITSYNDVPVAFFASPDSPLVDSSSHPPILKADFLERANAAMLSQETKMSYTGAEKMVYYSSLIRTPFNLCLIADENAYRSLFTAARTDFFFNVSIGIILIILGATLLTAFTTANLRRFIGEMDKIDSLVDLKPILYGSNDEFGRLVGSYNSLLARICNLIEDLKQSEHQKKILELKTLQSQIGPHFLYNTLACFGSLAKQGKLERLGEGIRNLIFLMGYSFDRTDDKVKLEEEIKVLESYCQIQKLRYGEVFDIRLRIDPETAGCRLPKLILQPIVENAIFHGILPKYRRGSISIDSSLQNGRLVITVTDDGIGMNQKQLSQLFTANDGTEFNKIGIKNVDERIKLNYGEDYGLSVESMENSETVVTLTLPAL